MKLKTMLLAALCTASLGLAGCADPEVENAQLHNRMPESASTLNCAACHAADHKVVGPSWKDIGDRYRSTSRYEYNGTEYPLVEGLVKKVSRGGAGQWGSMPMPAIDPSGVRREQVEHLVKLILKLHRD